MPSPDTTPVHARDHPYEAKYGRVLHLYYGRNAYDHFPQNALESSVLSEAHPLHVLTQSGCAPINQQLQTQYPAFPFFVPLQAEKQAKEYAQKYPRPFQIYSLQLHSLPDLLRPFPKQPLLECALSDKEDHLFCSTVKNPYLHS